MSPLERAEACRDALVAFMTTSGNWTERELAEWLAVVDTLVPLAREDRRALSTNPLHDRIEAAHDQLHAIFLLANESKRPVGVARLVLASGGSELGDRVCALWARSYVATHGVFEPQGELGDEAASGVFPIVAA